MQNIEDAKQISYEILYHFRFCIKDPARQAHSLAWGKQKSLSNYVNIAYHRVPLVTTKLVLVCNTCFASVTPAGGSNRL